MKIFNIIEKNKQIKRLERQIKKLKASIIQLEEINEMLFDENQVLKTKLRQERRKKTGANYEKK